MTIEVLSKISKDLSKRVIGLSKLSLSDALEKIYHEDVEKQKTWTPTDSNGTVYKYSEDRECFVGTKDENEWIMEVDTLVPIYWHYCPTVIGKHPKGYDITCRTRDLVLITEDGDKHICKNCKKESIIKIELDPKSPQYELLQLLKKSD